MVFWKMIRPFFSIKTCKSSKIMLVKNDEFVNKSSKFTFDPLNHDNVLIFSKQNKTKQIEYN